MKITRRSVVTNTIWSSVAMLGAQIVALLVVPLFFQNLGEELYGIWVIAYVILGFCNIFDFGFTQGLQKYVAEARAKGDQQELSEVVVSGLGFLTLIGLVIGTVVILSAEAIVHFFNISPEHETVATQLLKIAGLFSIFLWPLRITEVALNAAFRIKELGVFKAILQVLHSLTMLVMVYFDYPILAIKWATASLTLLFSLLGLGLVFKYVSEIDWNPIHFQLSQLRRMYGFSLGMFYISILSILSVRIDNLILGKIVGISAVAIYTILSKPHQIIKQICSMAMQTLIPASYNILPSATVLQRETLIINAVKYRTLILAPVTGVAVVMVPDFINLWVGEKYLQFAIWGQLFVGIHFFMGLSSLGNVARVAGAMRLVNTMLSVKVLTNLVISIILAKMIGIGGVIVGTLLSNILFGELIFGRFICKKMNVSWRHVLRNYFHPTAIGLLGMIFLLSLDIGQYVNSWVQLFLVSLISYGVLLSVKSIIFLRKEIKDLVSLARKYINIKS